MEIQTISEDISQLNNHSLYVKNSSKREQLNNVLISVNSCIRFKRHSQKYRNSFLHNKTYDQMRSIQSLESRLFIDPYSPSYFYWLIIVSVFVLYNLIFIIGRAVFWELNNYHIALWLFLDYFSDFIYIIDILIKLHEGFLQDGIMVRNMSKLRLNYIKSKKCILDIISILPTDIVYIWWHPSHCQNKIPCPVLVRLNRIFRIPRLFEFFNKAHTNSTYSNILRICKVFLSIIILMHLNACLYFTISYIVGFGSDEWVYNLNDPINSQLSRQYIYCFYWATLVLTTVGETPSPQNNLEFIFIVINQLFGVLIFASIVGNVGSVISNMQAEQLGFQDKIDKIKKYMSFRKVSSGLEKKVIKWFEYTWAQSGDFDEDKVLSALPEKFKAEIAINVHFDTLRKVWIFQDCDPGLLEALVLKLKLQVFSPGDYICRKGDIGKEMYIVKSGMLEVVGDDEKTIIATLRVGSVFGELSLLEIAGNRTGNRRTANVRSLGYTDLFCLGKNDLLVALNDYPEAKVNLIERGSQLLQKDGLLHEDNSEQISNNDNHLKKIEDILESVFISNKEIIKNQQMILSKLK